MKEESLPAQHIWKTKTGAERVRCRIPGNDSRFRASYRKQLLKGSWFHLRDFQCFIYLKLFLIIILNYIYFITIYINYFNKVTYLKKVSEKMVGFNFCVNKTLLRNNYFWSQISKHFSPGIQMKSISLVTCISLLTSMPRNSYAFIIMSDVSNFSDFFCILSRVLC